MAENAKGLSGRCLINLIIQYWICLFFININTVHHLKPEIALVLSNIQLMLLLTNIIVKVTYTFFIYRAPTLFKCIFDGLR